MTAMAGRRVVVVGGGLAGMAAALECADHNAQVILLERRSRLGGLTWSFTHGDLTMDNGQHVYLRCCEQYQRFLDRIGAAGDVEAPRPLDIPVVSPGDRGPVVGRLRRSGMPAPLHLASSLVRYPHLNTASKLSLGRALAGLARLDLNDPRLDRVSFGDWLAQRGQSHEAVSALWDLITVPTVNLPAAGASLSVAAMVMKTALLTTNGAADIGWSRVPLGTLHGSRGARALARAGVDVRLGTRVRQVVPLDRGWEVATGDGPIAADGIILALPHQEAAAVLAPGTVPGQEGWAGLGSSAIVDVHLVFDRVVSGWEVFAGHRSLVQWVFDRTSASGLAARHPGRQYLAVSLSAADPLLPQRPEALISSTVTALASLLPPVAGARLVDAVVTKERRATFAARPGTGTLRPPPGVARAGLALAGSWTATGWPATMEGAVRSGWQAARSLSDSLASQPSITQEVA